MAKKKTNTLGEGVLSAFAGLIDALVIDSIERNAGLLPGLTAESKGPVLLNRTEAAEYMAVGVTTIDSLRRAGEFKTAEIGGNPKYRKADLDRYIRKQMKEA